MTVYTVHEPPPGARDGKSWADSIQFVRDGFYFWAFLLGPVWMLWRRMWLVFVFFVIVTVAAQLALWLLEAPHQAGLAVGFLIAVLIGFEAGSLRRWTLRRWRERGIVVAPTLEQAERRFFEMWPARHSSPQAAPTSPAPPPSMPPGTHVPTSDADVIGLFPQPQPRQ